MVLPTPQATPVPAPRHLRRSLLTSDDLDPGAPAGLDASSTNNPGDQLERPPGIVNDKPSPPFRQLVGLFHKLRDSKPAERKNILSHWFTMWRQQVGNDLYPAMRLILPQKDRERATYGLKEHVLAKTYIAALGLEKTSKDAVRLVRWKQPTQDNVTAGDFPSVVYEVVKSRSSVETGTITVDELNDVLDTISKSGKEAGYAKIFSKLLDTCTPEEHRWIVRIILKDLNISVRETTVLAVFHPDAMDMFNTSSDLKRVCWILPSQEHRAPDTEKHIQLFQAFQPMLCKRGNSLQEAVKLMGKKDFLMEEKLDGERMQLHKRGNQYYYSSRKGKDYTYLYGAHVGEGALTPFIQGAIKDMVVDIVLDGEMLVWDPNLEKYCSFGNLKTAALDAMKSNAIKGDGPRPCFKVFDILTVTFDDGKRQLLTDVPLKNRKKVIDWVISEIPGRFECATQKMGKTIQDVEKLLQEIVEARGEGLVLKSPTSKYIPGGRENSWVKVKPEYMDKMSEEVDLLVVAGNWGQGRRGGKVSTLIGAVKDDSASSALNSKTRYSTFVRIGTGLTMADYEWINTKNWKRMDRRNPPSWLRVSTSGFGSEDRGDVYLEPEESFIITVKAASITPTDQYGCNMTMRFPRCTHVRDDINLDEIMTYSELVLLAQGKRKSNEDEEKSGEKKKQKRTTGRRAVAQLAGQYKGQSMKGVVVKSDLFEGITFRIFPDSVSKPPNDKASLERLVYEYGGNITQALTKNVEGVVLIYGGTVQSLLFSSIIAKDDLNIIKPSWIFECIEQDLLVHPTSKHFFYATTETRKEKEKEFQDEEAGEGDDNGMSEPGAVLSDRDKPTNSTRHSSAENSETEDEELSQWLQVTAPVDKSTENRLLAIQDSDGSDTEDEYDILPLPRRGISETEDAFSGSEEEEEDDISQQLRKNARGKLDDGLVRRVSEMDVNAEDVDDDVAEKSQSTIKDSIEMGEDEAAMEYDPNQIFKHLCFYLDLPSQARTLGLQVKVNEKVELAVTTKLSETSDLITANGGKVTSDIDHPKLTHIVVHEKDKARRVELMRRTMLPKRRHIVTPAFIEDSIAEESILNEDAYAP